MHLFDNTPNTTDGIPPPPPQTGYVQQTAGTAGARFEHMRAASDPVARPTYRKMQEAAKIHYKCCKGLLCNHDARPDGDTMLNFSSNVTAILVLNGFQSRRSAFQCLTAPRPHFCTQHMKICIFVRTYRFPYVCIHVCTYQLRSSARMFSRQHVYTYSNTQKKHACSKNQCTHIHTYQLRRSARMFSRQHIYTYAINQKNTCAYM